MKFKYSTTHPMESDDIDNSHLCNKKHFRCDPSYKVQGTSQNAENSTLKPNAAYTVIPGNHKKYIKVML